MTAGHKAASRGAKGSMLLARGLGLRLHPGPWTVWAHGRPSPFAPGAPRRLLPAQKKEARQCAQAFQGLELKGDKGRGYRRPLTD